MEPWLVESQTRLLEFIESKFPYSEKRKQELIFEYQWRIGEQIKNGSKNVVKLTPGYYTSEATYGSFDGIQSFLNRFSNPKPHIFATKVIGIGIVNDKFFVCTNKLCTGVCSDGDDIYFSSKDGIYFNNELISNIPLKGIQAFENHLYGFNQNILYIFEKSGKYISERLFGQNIRSFSLSTNSLHVNMWNTSVNLKTEEIQTYIPNAFPKIKNTQWFLTVVDKKLYIVTEDKKHYECRTFSEKINQVEIHPNGKIAVVTNKTVYTF